jgi:hypothetical protein
LDVLTVIQPTSTQQQQQQQQQHQQQQQQQFQQQQQQTYRDIPPKSFQYDPYPTSNLSRSNVIVTRRTTESATQRTTSQTTAHPGQKPTRDPFDDPNRYRVPQTRQQSDQVRFVNGRPYK